MLATYQAKITQNQIEWLDIPPKLDNTMVTITVLPNMIHKKNPFQISEKLRNSVKVIDNFDIVNNDELGKEWTTADDDWWLK